MVIHARHEFTPSHTLLFRLTPSVQVLEETRKISECDVEKFKKLDNSEKPTDVLGDRLDGGHKRRNRKGIG